DLVLLVIDDLAERVPAPGDVDRRKLTFEDRVLQVVAEVPHGFKDLAKALVVANVVADEVGITHGQNPCVSAYGSGHPWRVKSSCYLSLLRHSAVGNNKSGQATGDEGRGIGPQRHPAG